MLGSPLCYKKPGNLDTLLEHIANHLHPTLSPLQQEQAARITSCLAAFNARRWEELRTLLTPDVTYFPPAHSIFTSFKAIFGQEAVLTHAQRVLCFLPWFRIDQSLIVPYRQRLVTRFRGSWQGLNGQQQQQIAGAAFLRFRGEWISQIGVGLNTRRLRALLELPPAETAIQQ